MEAVRNVESEVRELIRRTGLDPSRDTREVDRLVRDAVADYDEPSADRAPFFISVDQCDLTW